MDVNDQTYEVPHNFQFNGREHSEIQNRKTKETHSPLPQLDPSIDVCALSDTILIPEPYHLKAAEQQSAHVLQEISNPQIQPHSLARNLP